MKNQTLYMHSARERVATRDAIRHRLGGSKRDSENEHVNRSCGLDNKYK